MTISFFVYLLKAAISFTFLYGVYALVLKKTTFLALNRFLLLFILFCSILIPSIPFDRNLITNLNFNDSWFYNPVHELNDSFYVSEAGQEVLRINLWQGLSYLYLGISLFIFGLLIKQIGFLIHIKRVSETVKQGKFTLVLTTPELPPFSFFNWIFIPEPESAETRDNPIIEHEKAHATQLHSIDLLITELFIVFFWFVPFVYSFKRSIKTVHEYLADKQALKFSSTEVYLNLLKKQTQWYTLYGVSSNFYYSTLKKRILMITKNKTSKSGWIIYLALIPAISILLLSFSSPVNSQSNNLPVSKSKNVPDLVPLKGNYSISSGYGMRIHPMFKEKKMMHEAIDFQAEEGTPIVATADGVIVKEEFLEKGQGKVIVIKHSDEFQTFYSHLSEFKVKLGDKVKKGEVIGLVGSSGLSTGPHLHYEVIKNGKRVNPADYY